MSSDIRTATLVYTPLMAALSGKLENLLKTREMFWGWRLDDTKTESKILFSSVILSIDVIRWYERSYTYKPRNQWCFLFQQILLQGIVDELFLSEKFKYI